MGFIFCFCFLSQTREFLVFYIRCSPSAAHCLFNENKLLTRTLQATCGTLLSNENKLPTHTLRATCGTLLSNENKLLTHTLQATCGTLLTNENELRTPFTIFGQATSRMCLTSAHPKPTDQEREPTTTRAPPSSKEPAKPSGG